jgi:small-conductance mechanosensitive channel
LLATAVNAGPLPATDSGWNRRLTDLQTWLEPVAGGWLGAELVLGITWLQLILAAAALGLAAAVAQILRGLVKRRLRRDEGPAADTSRPEAPAGPPRAPWLKPCLEALLPPATLLVWLWGGCAACALLFAHWRDVESPSLFLAALAWVRDVGQLGALLWAIFRLIGVVERQLARWTTGTRSKWDDVLAALVVRALRLLVPLAGVILVIPTLRIPEEAQQLFQKASSLLLIFAVGFIAYQLVQAVEQALLGQYRLDVRDNLEARKIYTQVQVLKKLAMVLIVVFTGACMLMVFDTVRQLGASILASAGVLGIIVGFAAQKSIATVVAGFQIAITQPIRLDDVVIVEGEWGRIEEITLTYVVVRIWDLRRLIVPINYFIEKPFQNWTRVSADLLGSVFLHVDYTVPLRALRAELDRLLAGSKLWDGKVKVIQVTDAKATAMEVRVLVSAADASSAWDLRCELRERLIDFLRRHYPQSLPRTRVELGGTPAAAGPVS